MSAAETFISSATERHPLQPFLPDGARLLMLGSFPPSRRRWCMDFFYPNFINDMWRIFGLVFFNDKERFVDAERKLFRKDDIIDFLTRQGIALYDTACEVCRTKNTASDKDLLVVRETDIAALLSHLPLCNDIITTGQKATDILTNRFGVPAPRVGTFVSFTYNDRSLRLWRLPSSSRAYPMKLERKAEQYRKAFSEIFGLGLALDVSAAEKVMRNTSQSVFCNLYLLLCRSSD